MEGIIIGLLLPFAGTTLGASCVYFMKTQLPAIFQKCLIGFASGVMVAASVWSLLIPAMEMANSDGAARVFPAAVGFMAGILFLLGLDRITPHQHMLEPTAEGPRSRLSKTTKLALAVTLHNIPEGMAVGVTLAAALEQSAYISMTAAVALAIGIAIQNFPEGAIVAMPLRGDGKSRRKSFILGTVSGAVEPVSAILTLMFASVLLPAMPYLLSFAAGAMLYVVVEELIPETQEGKHSNMGTIGFAIGFTLMMILDVVLG